MGKPIATRTSNEKEIVLTDDGEKKFMAETVKEQIAKDSATMVKELPNQEMSEKDLESIDAKRKELEALHKLNEEVMQKNPLMEMYCLACGRLIKSDYKGEMWGSDCFCMGEDNIEKQLAKGKCVKIMEGAKAGTWDILLSSSMALKDFSFEARTCTCKTPEEHKQKSVEKFLGKSWKTISVMPEVQKLRLDFEKAIQDKCDAPPSGEDVVKEIMDKLWKQNIRVETFK